MKKTLRGCSWYRGPELICGGLHFKRIMAAAYRSRGWGGKTYGRTQTWINMVVKALPRVPIKPYLAAKRRLQLFGLQLQYGCEAEAYLSVISHRNVICVFTAQRGLSRASMLKPALQTSVSSSLPLAKGGVGVRGSQCMCVSESQSEWVGGRGRCGGFVQ